MYNTLPNFIIQREVGICIAYPIFIKNEAKTNHKRIKNLISFDCVNLDTNRQII